MANRSDLPARRFLVRFDTAPHAFAQAFFLAGNLTFPSVDEFARCVPHFSAALLCVVHAVGGRFRYLRAHLPSASWGEH